jgi:sigma-B regulation protein RsbU (phosphoserine phosphatase)
MPPVRLARDGKIDEPGLDVGGPPLGIMNDIPFEAIELDIHPGESLTLYTDGIFEAPDAAGEQFSMERVRQLVRQSQNGIENCGDEIMKQVQEHIVGCDQEDDMCLVIIGRDI